MKTTHSRVSNKEYKLRAKANISKQSSDMMLIGFATFIIVAMMSAFTLSVAAFLVGGAFEYGVYKVFYRNSIGEKIRPEEMFDGFKDKLGDSFVAGFVVQLIKEIPFFLRIINVIATILTILSILGIAGFGQSESYWDFAQSLTVVAVILNLFAYFLLLQYSMAQYILFREKEISAINALRKSRACMGGFIWRYILLRLSFVLWALLSVVTFGLSNIYSRAYFYATEIAFFNDVYDAFNNDENTKEIYESITDDKEDNEIGGIYIG